VQALLASGTGKPPTAHVEVARGTRAQAVAYLRKGAQGDALQALVEYERPTPQRPVVRGRDRVSELMQRIIDQEPYDALLLQYGAVLARHGAFVDRLFLHYQPPPLWRDVRCAVFYGDTRTGKSRLAVDILCDLFPGQRPYKKDGATKWWDGYRFQKGVLIDDFEGDAHSTFSSSRPTIDHMLRWTDGQECPIEIKGSQWTAYWARVIITSNKPVPAWYKHLPPAQRRALKARLPQIEFRARALQGVDYDALKGRVLQRLREIGFADAPQGGPAAEHGPVAA